MKRVKAQEGRALLQVVVVVVTNVRVVSLLVLLFVFNIQTAIALVLPEERADTLYHSYDGGGIKVDGPSILVRKNIADTVSFSANHYVDNISGASIDVVTQASAYTEKRNQKSVSVDYLYDKSIMSYSYTSSIENDYDAITQNINISQEMFGGLTTVGLGYSVGDNTIGRKNDLSFEDESDLRSYRVTLAQVLTKDMIMSLAYEIITDEGFLNNPYRSVRYDNSAQNDPVNPYLFEAEIYPNTRTSNAAAVAFKYYLPYRAVVSFGTRTFTDTWQITANDFDLGYTHTINDDWVFDIDFRFYSQTQASFYSDLFDFAGQFNFRARDKELSAYSYNSIGLGVSYEFGKNKLPWVKKGSVNFIYNRFSFDYENFTDITNSTLATLGREPGYSFSAGVIRFFVSVWY
jgi:hypothetical protein